MIQQPLDLVTDPEIRYPLDISLNDIREAAAASIEKGQPTWADGFKFAASGTLTNIHVHGMIGMEVTLGANLGFPIGDLTNAAGQAVTQGSFEQSIDTAQIAFQDPTNTPVGLQLYGYGSLKVIGQTIADAGVMLNFSDPINPKLDIAAKLPAEGSLLALLFPIDGSLGLRLDSNGLVAGSVVAMQTFLQNVIADGGSLFHGILGDIAANLQQNRDQLLAQVLLDGKPADTVITVDLLRDELLAILDVGAGLLTDPNPPSFDDPRIKHAILAATELLQHISSISPPSVRALRQLVNDYQSGDADVVSALDAVASDLNRASIDRSGNATSDPDTMLVRVLLNTDLTRVAAGLGGFGQTNYIQELSAAEIDQVIDGAFLADRFATLLNAASSPDSADPWIDDSLVTLVADELLSHIGNQNASLVPSSVNQDIGKYLDPETGQSVDFEIFELLLDQAINQVVATGTSFGIGSSDLEAPDPFNDPAAFALRKTIASTAAAIRQQFQVATAMGEIFVNAGGAAFDKFFDVIDPSLTIMGEVQPVLLGIPIGEPREQIDVRIDKTQLHFEGTFRVLEKLMSISPIPIPLYDEINVSVDIPFENLFRDLFVSGFPQIDPQRDWRGTFRGTLRLFDIFDLGDVAGLVFPAIDPSQVDPANDLNRNQIPDDHPLDTHVQVFQSDPDLTDPSFDPGSAMFGPPPESADDIQQFNKVVVLANDLGTLKENGGLLLDARLTLPQFITDPFAWYNSLRNEAAALITDDKGNPVCDPRLNLNSALDCFLHDPAGIMEFAASLPSRVTNEHQVAQVQLFVPSFFDELGDLFDINDPSGAIDQIRQAVLTGQFDASVLRGLLDQDEIDALLETLVNDTYFRGEFGDVPLAICRRPGNCSVWNWEAQQYSMPIQTQMTESMNASCWFKRASPGSMPISNFQDSTVRWTRPVPRRSPRSVEKSPLAASRIRVHRQPPTN